MLCKNITKALDANGMVSVTAAEINNGSFDNCTLFSLSLAPGSFTCLLYTSDAADERSSVDLGGRRIIKKKKKEKIMRIGSREEYNAEEQQRSIIINSHTEA